MNDNTAKAAELLKSEAYTCVLCGGERVYTSTERGVKPLLVWLGSGADLRGLSAADKVVGKAAALLYALLGVSEVYAPVMSAAAEKALKSNGISAYFDVLTEKIVNRSNTEICPMEEAVERVDSPREAEIAIRKRLTELQNRK